MPLSQSETAAPNISDPPFVSWPMLDGERRVLLIVGTDTLQDLAFRDGKETRTYSHPVARGPRILCTRTREPARFILSTVRRPAGFLLPFMPERVVKAAIELGIAEGPRTRRIGVRSISFKALRAVINDVRRQGYLSIDPPPVPGVSALSAPVFDHLGQMQMAFTLGGPSSAMDTSSSSSIIPILLAFAHDMSMQLGEGSAPFEQTSAVSNTLRFRGATSEADGRQSRSGRS